MWEPFELRPYLPGVVSLAVGLSISDKACVRLVEEHLTLATLEASGMPLEVRRHAQDELVVDGAAAPDATPGRLIYNEWKALTVQM